MKIERSTLAPTLAMESGSKARKSESASPAALPSVIAEFNKPSYSTEGDIDMAKVNEIKAAIEEGRFEINAGRIADGLMQSVRDLLG